MGSNMAQLCASVVPFAGQSHILIRLTAYQSFKFVWWDLAHSASYSRECTGCAFFMQAPPNKQMPEVSATLGQLDAARVQFETVRVQRCCISPCGKNGQFLFMSASCRSNCLKLRLPTKQAGMRQRSNFHSLLIASCVLAQQRVCLHVLGNFMHTLGSRHAFKEPTALVSHKFAAWRPLATCMPPCLSNCDTDRHLTNDSRVAGASHPLHQFFLAGHACEFVAARSSGNSLS